MCCLDAVVDPSMSQEVQITLIATGFGATEPAADARGVASAGAGQQATALQEQQSLRQPPLAAPPGPAQRQGSPPPIQVPEFLRKRRPKAF